MTDAERATEARQLLLAQTDRAASGSLEDPALVAAVVGVERLVVATGSTDEQTLRDALEGRPVPGSDAEAVATLVAEAEQHVLAGLARRASGQSVDAGVINPDAGTYRMTTDAMLLRAAVRAGQRSFDVMPYYRIRYGERGSRFASSDSAWLISLAPLGADRATRQVLWLSGVLAGRGMPSWLMELHLDELVTEVGAVAGEAAVGALPAARDAVAGARRAHVDDELLDRADAWADDLLGADLPVPRTGALLAAATADALAGVTLDDHSLVGWLTDPVRTTPEAAASLRELRQRIRDAARP
ncbi:hypothetical protein [Intrasporangium flavum]|uniref:hypothetical protein n=1 Tax=Intrasporangium flavum TaxID=1428657 RepID=UPI001A964727|nr:hypothetical protein [Intrasporangium flavum]